MTIDGEETLQTNFLISKFYLVVVPIYFVQESIFTLNDSVRLTLFKHNTLTGIF